MLRDNSGSSAGRHFRGIAPTERSGREEENLADLIAAEILMPLDAMRNIFAHRQIAIDTLLLITQKFQVSFPAAMRRAVAVSDTPLLYINAVPHRFRNVDTYAEIDEALYIWPNKLQHDREKTRFVRRYPFARIKGASRVLLSVIGSVGQVLANFDVKYNRKPFPNCHLLTVLSPAILRPSVRYSGNETDQPKEPNFTRTSGANTMADSNKIAKVVAMLCERDEDFKVFQNIAISVSDDNCYWPLCDLKRALGYEEEESIENAVNRAKISATKAGFSIKEHFVEVDDLFGKRELCLTKYAALLVVINADVEKTQVALAQAYFALQVDRQRLEDEKRLRTRLEVTTENRNLASAAKHAGVMNFEKFNGVGISALYGGLSVASIKARKGIPQGAQHLDYAGSEELAANLFRITQTAASLRRQELRNENVACQTHMSVAQGIRQAIRRAGNTLPENLPKAETKIDQLATAVKQQLIPAVGRSLPLEEK
jgi:DNA-damage-inducible protein D